jgi:hypothetical protein
MILYKSSVIILDYHPALDILEVVYPDLESFMLPEIKKSLHQMVEAIRHYDVKKLLLDARETVINVSDEENRELTLQLAADLAKTRLVKVARVLRQNPAMEERSQQNIEKMKQAGLLTYRLRSFANKEEALNWLASSD